MAKKKILLLIPNLDFGGAQRVFNNLSKALAEEFDVTECVFNLHTPQAFFSGNPLINLDIPAGKNLLDKAFRFFQRCHRVHQIKKNYSFNLTVSHLEGADYVNYFSGGNSIACIHGSKVYDQNIQGPMGWFRKKIAIPFVYHRIRHLVAVSQGIKHELSEQFHCKKECIKVINNGLDIEDIVRQSLEPLDSEKQSLFENHKVVIAHGRLVDEKNHLLLLNVFSDEEIHKLVKLVIIGDGPLRNHLIEQCHQLGLNCYHPWANCMWSTAYDVYFFGYQINSFQFLACAWLYVLPSKYEGYPMAICEALICRMPVLAADCHYGPRDILEGSEFLEYNEHVTLGQLGILLKTYDPHAWKNTLLQIIQNNIPIEGYREEGKNQVAAFSLTTFTTRWRQAIVDALYQ